MVILIEQLWTFCDATFSEKRAKILYGFLAGGCSIGGIVASVLTSELASVMGSKNLIFVGCGALLLGVWLFVYANGKGGDVLIRARKKASVDCSGKRGQAKRVGRF